MKIKIALLFFTAALILISDVFSQQDSSDFKFITHKNKKDSTLLPFYAEQGDWFRNPEIPSFVFQGPDKKFSLGIGGFFNYTASYDFDGISDNLDFVTYDIIVPNDTIQKSQFQMYANTSLLYFKVITKTSHGNLVGYVSANFRGDGNNFNLYQMYIRYIGFDLGVDWSTFSDAASWPVTINYVGLNSMSDALSTLIRYSYKFANGWKFTLGVEQPEFNTAFTNTGSLKQTIPDIPAYLQYSFGNSHVRLSGLYRNLFYRDNISNADRTVTGTGISMTGNVEITKKAQIFFQGLYGKGIGKYVQDLSIDDLSVTPVSAQSGELTALPVYAYYGALQYNFNSKFFTTIMYSQLKVQPDNFYSPSSYSFARQFTGNFFWQFLPAANVGLEYNFGDRTNQNGQNSIANRVEFMMQYNF